MTVDTYTVYTAGLSSIQLAYILKYLIGFNSNLISSDLVEMLRNSYERLYRPAYGGVV